MSPLLVALLFVPASPARALAPLQAYVGHCWSAAMDQGVSDRHCLEPVFGGAHIRDSHVVTRDGKAVYAGETLYSAEGDQISFTYWNSLGGVGQGTARLEAGLLIFRLRMRSTPDATPRNFVTSWHRTDAGYDVVTNGVIHHFKRDDK